MIKLQQYVLQQYIIYTTSKNHSRSKSNYQQLCSDSVIKLASRSLNISFTSHGGSSYSRFWYPSYLPTVKTQHGRNGQVSPRQLIQQLYSVIFVLNSQFIFARQF
ncbi:Hypothetical_protein [Hexamita inflata]|uniref:Hypothetical_protein n=1 Tax=Hexamita inflata TaxID=28002 RepID=A0AA86QTE6_9EUKA|nr:Hypothetical protein HINF_LOCUS48082 [Hexamita inflata]